MNTINALLLSTIAGLSTLLGSFIILFKINKKDINNFISFCLSFSISIMIGISITELLPESLINIFLNYKYYVAIPITLLSLLLGYYLIGVTNHYINNKDSLYKLGILTMIALMIHNLPEGIATFMGSIKDSTLGIKLTIAIMLHNIPEGISIAVPIYYSTNSKSKAFLYTLLSGLAEPCGALLTYLILGNYITDLSLNIVLLLVSNIMITLAIEELFPKALSYNKSNYMIYGFISGIILIAISIILF